jgi:hypothetical protein
MKTIRLVAGSEYKAIRSSGPRGHNVPNRRRRGQQDLWGAPTSRSRRAGGAWSAQRAEGAVFRDIVCARSDRQHPHLRGGARKGGVGRHYISKRLRKHLGGYMAHELGIGEIRSFLDTAKTSDSLEHKLYKVGSLIFAYGKEQRALVLNPSMTLIGLKWSTPFPKFWSLRSLKSF